jgi:hypothetical protein
MKYLYLCLCVTQTSSLISRKIFLCFRRSNRQSSHSTNSVAPQPEGSSPHSQQPATDPYPEPDESTPHPPTSLPKVHFDPILPSTTWSFKWLFPSDFPITFLPSPMCATCPAHLIPLDLICLTVSGEEYKL